MCITSGILTNQEIEQVLQASRLCTLAICDPPRCHEDQPLLFICEYRIIRDGDDIGFILESATPGVSIGEIERHTKCALLFQIRCNNVIKTVICYGKTEGEGPCTQFALRVDADCLIGREYCFN